jgi:hypothetical protein
MRAPLGAATYSSEGVAVDATHHNNKLTVAAGFTARSDHPLRADILSVSVGTGPGNGPLGRLVADAYIWYAVAEGCGPILSDRLRARRGWTPRGHFRYQLG